MTSEQYVTIFFVFCICVAGVFLLLAMNNPTEGSNNPLRFNVWRFRKEKQLLSPRGWRYYKIAGVISLIGLIPVLVTAVAHRI